jgi:hypothetical protein
MKGLTLDAMFEDGARMNLFGDLRYEMKEKY